MSQTNTEWPLPVPDALGPLVGADDVADALEATLAEWSPYYTAILSSRLQKAEKIGGRSQMSAPLKPFGTWTNEPDWRSIGTGVPAAYQVRVAATVGEPDREGRGLYIATWRAQIELQVFGTNWQQTRDATNWYEKIARWSIAQHPSLGGFATRTRWVGSSYNGIDHAASRTEGQCVLGFDVKVRNVLDDTRGPSEVPPIPTVPPQDPTVETASVTITAVRPTEPLEG